MKKFNIGDRVEITDMRDDAPYKGYIVAVYDNGCYGIYADKPVRRDIELLRSLEIVPEELWHSDRFALQYVECDEIELITPCPEVCKDCDPLECILDGTIAGDSEDYDDVDPCDDEDDYYDDDEDDWDDEPEEDEPYEAVESPQSRIAKLKHADIITSIDEAEAIDAAITLLKEKGFSVTKVY